MRLINFLGAAVVLAAILLFGKLPEVSAATINVDSDCTLAQAITSANDDDAPSGSSCEDGDGSDTINLSANVSLSADLPTVTTTMTVQGGGYTIDGGDTHHIFHVTDSGNLTVNNATLANSKAKSRSNNRGGAFAVDGATATLTNSRITSSSSQGDGGGFWGNSNATVTISNVTIDDNQARNGISSHYGGGLYLGYFTTATVSHVTIYNNVSQSSGSGPCAGIC